MENNTEYYDYDYGNYSYEAHAEVCNWDQVNRLGVQLSVLFYFMFVLSFLGNGLVLFIIHRFERLTTVTNILLLNLVLSSLIFMSSLPFLAVYIQLSNWIFGKVMCKLVVSVYYLGFYSSVLFLTLLTFDRHLTVVYSLSVSKVRSRRYAVISCCVVWLVSGLACIIPVIVHNAVLHRLDNKMLCEVYYVQKSNINIDHLKKSTFYLHLFLFFIFPLVVVIYCYIRIAITVMSSKIAAKFKTVRLIFVTVVLFFICWTPYNITLLFSFGRKVTCEERKRWVNTLQITRAITCFYCFISPIFYTFVGNKFQNYFRQLMMKRIPSLKKEINGDELSRSNMSTKNTPNEL